MDFNDRLNDFLSIATCVNVHAKRSGSLLVDMQYAKGPEDVKHAWNEFNELLQRCFDDKIYGPEQRPDPPGALYWKFGTYALSASGHTTLISNIDSCMDPSQITKFHANKLEFIQNASRIHSTAKAESKYGEFLRQIISTVIDNHPNRSVLATDDNIKSQIDHYVHNIKYCEIANDIRGYQWRNNICKSYVYTAVILCYTVIIGAIDIGCAASQTCDETTFRVSTFVLTILLAIIAIYFDYSLKVLEKQEKIGGYKQYIPCLCCKRMCCVRILFSLWGCVGVGRNEQPDPYHDDEYYIV
jgi:hypothetical protein